MKNIIDFFNDHNWLVIRGPKSVGNCYSVHAVNIKDIIAMERQIFRSGINSEFIKNRLHLLGDTLITLSDIRCVQQNKQIFNLYLSGLGQYFGKNLTQIPNFHLSKTDFIVSQFCPKGEFVYMIRESKVTKNELFKMQSDWLEFAPLCLGAQEKAND